MNILFLCVANSSRSQIAEGLAKRWFDGNHTVQSAGSEPSQVNPFAVQALDEIGIDISSHSEKSVSELDATEIDVVITLCAEEYCPTFLGHAERIHWPIPDPVTTEPLGPEARLKRFRNARDTIASKLHTWAETRSLNMVLS